jgi:hypothetical protein
VLPVLQVAPALRQVQHLAADGSLVSSGMANAISIQLAGSWLPLEDMAGGHSTMVQMTAATVLLLLNRSFRG